jgi:hypothetical protein
MACSNANNQGCNKHHKVVSQEFPTINVDKISRGKCAKKHEGEKTF